MRGVELRLQKRILFGLQGFVFLAIFAWLSDVGRVSTVVGGLLFVFDEFSGHGRIQFSKVIRFNHILKVLHVGRIQQIADEVTFVEFKLTRRHSLGEARLNVNFVDCFILV